MGVFFSELNKLGWQLLIITKDMHLTDLRKVYKSGMEPRKDLYLSSISFRNKQSAHV